jgi:hypothetical protein
MDITFEDRDHPLVLRYNPPEGWLKPLGLAPASARKEQAQAQIAAIAVDKARHQPSYILYSRNRNHYARRGKRYDEWPDLYRFSIIPAAVDALADAGFVENEIAPRDPNYGRQSRFRATLALIEALGKVPPPLAKLKRRALVQLRDKDKQLIDFRDTERTRRMCRHLAEINEAIGSLKIELPGGIGERDDDVLVIGDSCINLGNNALYRIFNLNFRHGGRLYGHWTQGVPKRLRAELTIDGEPIAEPDYRAHHLRILYALDGLPLDGDPYDIDGWLRETVKRALLILINAPTRERAIRAIVYRCEIDRGAAERLVNELKQKHKPIEMHFHSGAGLRLQRIDSDMAERVELGQIRRGNPVLPIHDSFIVPMRYEGAVREQMEEAFETMLARGNCLTGPLPCWM